MIPICSVRSGWRRVRGDGIPPLFIEHIFHPPTYFEPLRPSAYI